jgi:hypothetical protein
MGEEWCSIETDLSVVSPFKESPKGMSGYLSRWDGELPFSRSIIIFFQTKKVRHDISS